MTPLLIHHPRILLPNGDFLLGNILMEGGKIVQVSPEITALDDITIIDATGLTLLPGVIAPLNILLICCNLSNVYQNASNASYSIHTN